MSYNNARYRAALHEFTNQCIEYESYDLYDKFMEMYKKLGPIEPFSKHVLKETLTFKTGSVPGAMFFNKLKILLLVDLATTMELYESLNSSCWYVNEVSKGVANNFVRMVAAMNDAQNRTGSEKLDIPVVPFLNRTKFNGYCSDYGYSVGTKFKKALDFDLYAEYADSVSVTGTTAALKSGSMMSFISDYDGLGQIVSFELSVKGKADTLLIEFADDIEHDVRINGENAKLAGLCLYKTEPTDSFNISILTLDYKRYGEKKYLMSIKSIGVFNTELMDSELELTLNMPEPLKLDLSEKGIYACNGGVVASVKRSDWQVVGSFSEAGKHIVPQRLDRYTEEKMLYPGSELLEFEPAQTPVDYSPIVLYGKYNSEYVYPTGYTEYNGRKYAFAYLSSDPGVDFYDLSWNKIEKFEEPGVYLLAFDNLDDVSELDIYAHVLERSNITTERSIKAVVPKTINRKLSFDSFEVDDFVPLFDYSTDLQKPELLYSVTDSAEINITDSALEHSIDMEVEQGYSYSRKLVAVAVLKRTSGFEFAEPHKISIVEPVEEDPAVKVKMTAVIHTDTLDDVQSMDFYLFDITGMEQKINSDGLSFNVTVDKYCAGVKVIPVLDNPRSTELYCNGALLNGDFSLPMCGELKFKLSSTEEFTAYGVLVIPYVPTKLISSNNTYYSNYKLVGIDDDSVPDSYRFKVDGIEVEEVNSSRFDVEIDGTVTEDCSLVYERSDNDSALLEYAAAVGKPEGLKLKLTVADGFQPVVTVPKFEVYFRW